MRGKIYKLSEDEKKGGEGECLGIIVQVGGKCILRTENESLRKVVEPMLEHPIETMDGGWDGRVHATFFRKVEPGDREFLRYLKYELLKKGLWMDVEE
jgi:hypothetical protein